MQTIDFLSLYPKIYVSNKSRAKNKFGGFLSILNVLIMIGLFIFYLTNYVLGKGFNVKYFSENIDSAFSPDELEDLSNKNSEFYFYAPSIINDCKIHPFLRTNNILYDESNITKCNSNLEIDPEGNLYCFNFSLYSNLSLGISGNCSDGNGKPYEFITQMAIPFKKINHTNSYPFKFDKNTANSLISNIPILTSKNSFFLVVYKFTSVLYKSQKIFSIAMDRFKEIYLSDISTITYNRAKEELNINNETVSIIYTLIANSQINCDVYEREYITLLDTLAKIGGFFSPVKLVFSILINMYSEYEVNYQIVKNLILKKNIYKNNIKNNNMIEIDKKLELNVENDLIRKKNKINSCLHFFGTIFKCCCQKRKTMRILNQCNELVSKHMSAENLIFNSILFEKYYENNPIQNIQYIEGLKEIEEELYNYNEEKELLIINDIT